MTEKEWLECQDPKSMLQLLGIPQRHNSEAQKVSDRKLRLFSLACFHSIRDKLSEATRAIVYDIELCVDGVKPMPARAIRADRQAEGILNLSRERGMPRELQCAVLRDIVGNPFRHVYWCDEMPSDSSEKRLFFNRQWLRWNGGCIPVLARQMYGSRNFGQMPILGDMLEDAGCTEAVMLDHCRETSWNTKAEVTYGHRCPDCGDAGFWRAGQEFDHMKKCREKGCGRVWVPGDVENVLRSIPAIHVRGCWVVDLILGKE